MRSCMQRVNGSLGNLMSDSCVWNNLAPEESGGSDWDLRWSNAALLKVMIHNNNSILIKLACESQLTEILFKLIIILLRLNF